MLAKKTSKSQITLPRAIVRQIPLRRTISTAHSKGGTVLLKPVVVSVPGERLGVVLERGAGVSAPGFRPTLWNLHTRPGVTMLALWLENRERHTCVTSARRGFRPGRRRRIRHHVTRLLRKESRKKERRNSAGARLVVRE